MYTTARITPAEFHRLTRPAVGLPVSEVWRGGGTAIFLELGALREVPGQRHARGELQVMIEWSWRVEGPRSIRFGSWSTDTKIDNGLPRLAGRRVLDVTLEGRIPELVVALSGGVWVHSFATVEPQPRWVLFLGDGDWCFCRRERLERQTRRE